MAGSVHAHGAGKSSSLQDLRGRHHGRCPSGFAGTGHHADGGPYEVSGSGSRAGIGSADTGPGTGRAAAGVGERAMKICRFFGERTFIAWAKGLLFFRIAGWGLWFGSYELERPLFS